MSWEIWEIIAGRRWRRRCLDTFDNPQVWIDPPHYCWPVKRVVESETCTWECRYLIAWSWTPLWWSFYLQKKFSFWHHQRILISALSSILYDDQLSLKASHWTIQVCKSCSKFPFGLFSVPCKQDDCHRCALTSSNVGSQDWRWY